MVEKLFETNAECKDNRVYVLIIYDIISDAGRRKLVKYLHGYGKRVQKSAFEAKIKKSLYRKLLAELPQYANSCDSIRVYKIDSDNDVKNYGIENELNFEQVIIV